MRIRYILLFLIIIGLGAAAAATAFIALPARLEKTANALLTDLGAQNFEHIRSRYKDGSLLFSNIDLDEKGFSSIQRIQIPYSWLDSFNPGLPRLTVYGLNLTGTIDNNGNIAIDGWSAAKTWAKIFKLPAASVEFKNGKIDLISEKFGGMMVRFDGQMSAGKGGGKIFDLQLEGQQKQLSFSAKAHGQVFAADNAQIDIEILDGKWDLAPVKISRASGNATYIQAPGVDPTLNAQINAGAANIHGIPWQQVNITVEKAGYPATLNVYAAGKALGQEEIEAGLSYALDKQGKELGGHLYAPDTARLLDYLARHGMRLFKKTPAWLEHVAAPTLMYKLLDDGSIEFEVTDAGQSIEAKGTFKKAQDGSISGKFTMPPAFLENMGDILRRGNATLSGNFTQAPAPPDDDAAYPEIKGDMTLKITDGEWRFGNLRFEDVRVTLPYSGLQAPETQKPAEAGFNLPLDGKIKQKGTALISHKLGSAPVIRDAKWEIFDGMLEAKAPDNGEATVNITSVNLQQLSDALNKKGVLITGQMKGTLPLAVEKGRTVIKDGVLSSMNGGIIKFAPKKIPAFLKGDDLRYEVVLEALKNYHYDNFEIKLSGPVDDEVDVILSAQGKNPGLFNDRPVAIDLKFKASLPAIFENMMKPQSPK